VPSKVSGELGKLRNIGAKTVAKLAGIGITSPAQLEELGAAETYRRLRAQRPVNIAMLWALQGALLGLPWYDLPPEIKQALLEELDGHRDAKDR